MPLGNDLDSKERVKQATDIVQLVGSYLQLRRQGALFVAHCPWHDDRRPSLQVHPVRQTWTCWVCDLRGDVFDFVMRKENVDFREALQILADRAGIPLQRGGPKATPGSPNDKSTLYKAMVWAAQAFQRALHHDETAAAARSYLQSRRVSADAISRFQLGFAPLEWSWLVDRARSSEFSPEVLEACGLLVRRGSEWTERYRGRLIFPIHDPQGRVIGFGGRLVPGVYPENHEPPGKYINSPETRLFSKSDNLYGLHLAADAVTRTRHLVVVEGYTDVIAAVQAGLREVVAALGTSITQRHIRLLRRYADRVTLVLDGDTAGQKRASEVLDLFVAESVDLRVLTLPEGIDPFDFFQRHSADEFRNLVATAPDALEHRLAIELRGVDILRDTHRAHQALDRVLTTLAQVPISLGSTDSAVRLRFEQMLVRLSSRFRLDPEALRMRLREIRQALSPTNSPGDSQGSSKPHAAWPTEKFAAHEMELLQLALLDATLLDLIIEQVDPSEFQGEALRQVYQTMCQGFHEQCDISFEGLLLLLEGSELKQVVIWLYDEAERRLETAGWDPRQVLDRLLEAFRQRRLEGEKRQIISRLEQGSLDQEEEVSALAELQNAARRRTGL